MTVQTSTGTDSNEKSIRYHPETHAPQLRPLGKRDGDVHEENSASWQQYSWRKYYQTVDRLSLGLISLGLERGDVVCIIGDNEPEWFWSEFAVQAAGAGLAPASTWTPFLPEVNYIAGHSGAKFAIVNDQEQTDKFLEIKANYRR